ncbi:MAG: efflux RND transporter periplasmic adaptor subunit [Peptococcaceae bacterium]|nr:efflux RND transporter periplasmic adaptor subunit [Peptococcaceae bacterium]
MEQQASGSLSPEAQEKPEKVKVKGRLKKFWKKKRKTAVALILAVFAVLFFAVKSLSGGDAGVLTVMTETAARQNIAETVVIKGTVEGSETAEITSTRNNKIVAINVKEGDRVTKGQVLAELDGEDLNEALTIAQDQYDQARYTLQESLKTAQREYEAAVRSRDQAKRSYETNKALAEAGAISQDELIKSQDAYENSQTALESFEVSKGKVVAGSSQAKALEVQKHELEIRTKDLEDIYIKSPIDGTVTRVNARLGRNAADTEDKQAMFVVENLDQLQMKVKISEYDINRIALGQKVTITSDILGGQPAEGVVSQISPSGEQKDMSSKEMVIPVKIEVVNDNGRLMAGVSGNAEILIRQSEDALAVPVDALLVDPATGETFVFVADEAGLLKKIVLELGVESDFYAEVTGGGLEEGMRIVMNPDFSMQEGMTVAAAAEGGAQ